VAVLTNLISTTFAKIRDVQRSRVECRTIVGKVRNPVRVQNEADVNEL